MLISTCVVTLPWNLWRVLERWGGVVITLPLTSILDHRGKSLAGGWDGWAVSSSWSKPKGDHVIWAAASLNHVNEGKHVGEGYSGSVQCLFSVCHNSSKRGISFSNSARPPFTNVTHIKFYLVLSSKQVSFSFCKGQDMSLLVIAANEVTSERKKRSQARKKRVTSDAPTIFQI